MSTPQYERGIAHSVDPLETAAEQELPPASVATSGRGIAAALLIQAGSAAATIIPPAVAMPVYVAKLDPSGKTTSLGLILGAYALIQMIFAPVFGALSDRTTSRFGMRRPGLLIGALIVVGSLVLQGLAANLTVIVAGMLLMSLGATVMTGSSQAIIPDQVQPMTRGRALGAQTLVLVVIGIGATIVGPMLLDDQFLLFTLGAAALVVTTAAALVLLKDRVLDKAAQPQQSLLKTVASGYAFIPRRTPDFSWVWLGRFLVTFGIAFSTAYSIYFLTDQLHVTSADLPPLISLSGVISLGGTVVGVIIGSFLSDRVGRRKDLVLLTGVVLVLGGVVSAFAPTVTVFMIGSAILSVALGSFVPVDGALVMDVLPGDGSTTGKYMSIISIADQLPRAIGPAIAPALIALGAHTPVGGYPFLFLLIGVFGVAGGLVVRQVRNAS